MSNYPLNDDDISFSGPVTTEYHKEPYSETNVKKLEFEVSGEDVSFNPGYYPTRVSVGKKRDLVREKGICRNEYVKDVGTENREIHITGYVTTESLQDFHNLVDFGQRCDMITMQWRGEVLVDDSDLDGPQGVDVNTGHFLYEYTLDFVSTGRDEMGTSTTGIIDSGVEPANDGMEDWEARRQFREL